METALLVGKLAVATGILVGISRALFDRLEELGLLGHQESRPR